MEKEKESFIINGKPLADLRVVDLKKELEKRKLSKSGSKIELMKRLKTQLKIENLQEDISETEIPNKKLSESVGEKSEYVKEYLEKQQKNYELMRHEKEQFRKESEQESCQEESEIESPTRKSVDRSEKATKKEEKEAQKDDSSLDKTVTEPEPEPVATKSEDDKTNKRKNTDSESETEPPVKKVPLILEGTEEIDDVDDVEQEEKNESDKEEEKKSNTVTETESTVSKDENSKVVPDATKDQSDNAEVQAKKNIPKRITSHSINEMFGHIKPVPSPTPPVEEESSEVSVDRQVIPSSDDNTDVGLTRTVVQNVTRKDFGEDEIIVDANEIDMEVGIDNSDNEIDDKNPPRTVEFKKTDRVSRWDNVPKHRPISPPNAENTKITRTVATSRQVSNMEIDVPLKPVRTGSPSPSRHPVSNVLLIRNLVRPFTEKQLKVVLNENGKLLSDFFWMDKIKTHCYAMYDNQESATEIRNLLHNSQWPSSNPKMLSVDYATEMDLYRHLSIDNSNIAAKMSVHKAENGDDRPNNRNDQERNFRLKYDDNERSRIEREIPRRDALRERNTEAVDRSHPESRRRDERMNRNEERINKNDSEQKDDRHGRSEQTETNRRDKFSRERQNPNHVEERPKREVRPHRDERSGRDERPRDERFKRDDRSQRENFDRERMRRDHVREWDRDKVGQRDVPARRTRSPVEGKKNEFFPPGHEEELEKSKPVEAPAKLLDELFHKTHSQPSIYWLPLTDEGAVERDIRRKKEKEEKELLRHEKEEEEKERRRKDLYETDPTMRENEDNYIE